MCILASFICGIQNAIKAVEKGGGVALLCFAVKGGLVYYRIHFN